jgi:acyl carrier protein
LVKPSARQSTAGRETLASQSDLVGFNSRDQHFESYDECVNMSEQREPVDLSARVIQVIAHTQRIPAEQVQLDSTFEELKIDSLDGINIIFALENEFGINIPDEGVQNLRSVRQTVEGVRKLVEEKQAVPPGVA